MLEILLVEDNPADVRLTREALREGALDPRLNVVPDGVEALAFLRREGRYATAPRPDVILLDLNLPRLSGREVLADIKGDPALRRIPVVVLTTSQAPTDIEQSYDLHANCYVTKSGDMEQFIEAMQVVERLFGSVARLPMPAHRAAPAPDLGRSAAPASILPGPSPAKSAPVLPTPASAPAMETTAPDHTGHAGAAAMAASGAAPLRVLLVEDNAADARLVQELLRDATVPVTLSQVDRLATARRLAVEQEYDAILLDLSLPDGYGLENVTALRGVAPRTPIVVMSGNDDEALAVKGVREGAQDYLVKGRVDGAGLVRSLRQAIERQRTEDKLAYLAHHDPLTGLPNRALMLDRLRQHLAHATRHVHPLAVLFLDLDGFKAVNDRHGHDAGDLLLREVARRLSRCTRGGDTVARLGGDEFVIVLPDLTETHAAATVAAKVLETVSGAYAVAGREVRIGVSVGISLYPDNSADPEMLLKQADQALYTVKARGKNGYAFHPPTGPAAAQALAHRASNVA